MATAFKVEGYILSYSARPTPVHTITIHSASKGVAILFFRPDGTALPANEIADGIIHLFYQAKEFPIVLDLIQHVKPLNVVFNPPSTGAFSGLNTPQVIPV